MNFPIEGKYSIYLQSIQKIMESKKMMSVAAMAMVLMILLSANTETVGVTAQGVNCWDSCNTACVGLPPRLYARCDAKCNIRCGPGNSVFPFSIHNLHFIDFISIRETCNINKMVIQLPCLSFIFVTKWIL